jgi:Tfp pilus assembly protein PilN
MKAVNLLPPDRPSTDNSIGLDPARKKLLLVCAGVAVLVIAGLSMMVWSSGSSVSKKRSELASIQAQIASTSSATSAAAAGTGTRKSTVIGLVANRLSWDQFLGTLSKVMPEDVWLESLQSTTAGAAATLASDQAAAAAAAASATAATTTTATTTTPAPAPPAATASTFTISGYTYSQPSVARMMRRLDLVPWLTGVTLVSSSKTNVGTDAVIQFSVKASVISPEATP